MKRFYYEVWSTGYLEAKNEKEAKKKILHSFVSELARLEDADLDVNIEEEDDDE